MPVFTDIVVVRSSRFSPFGNGRRKSRTAPFPVIGRAICSRGFTTVTSPPGAERHSRFVAGEGAEQRHGDGGRRPPEPARAPAAGDAAALVDLGSRAGDDPTPELHHRHDVQVYDFSSIVLAARNASGLREVADAVKSAGAEPLVCDVDLSNAESAKTLVKAALDRFGRIDALLNIAGAVPQIDLFEMTDEQWRAGMELKLHGARRVTILAWEALKESKGSVVFMSGSAALDPKPAFAAVASTNAAITALAKAFAEQGIKDGVQVNSIVPGAVAIRN